MKAVVRRDGQLVDTDIAEVTPGEGQVLVKTLVCGICGSDLHALHHLDHMIALTRRAGGRPSLDPSQDVVFGHEFCAEVIDHGPGCNKTLPPGTKVVSVPAAFGPAGNELVGYSNRFPGGFAERMVLQEALLLEVPNGLDDARAALTEPMAVGAHAVASAPLTPRSVALVIGCGPVGLSVIAALKARGIGPVIASDFSPHRRAAAVALGADVVIDPGEHSPHDRWEALDVPATLASFSAATLQGRSIRDAVVFECVGVPGMLQQLIEKSPPTATIIVVGVCMESDTIEPSLAINKQLSLRFVFGYSPAEFAATLHAIAEGQCDVSPLISGTVGRGGVAAAFSTLSKADACIKLLVDPGRA
ncbi:MULTISPECIES: zinc-binding dehydrogenase [unclassified Rhodopseudomonas]|uniref:zinc-binding dehydrogenase n=1 Tax=unclassified Rhodopseudomonas TaxID=2638247 RepID=UPI0013DF287A|nr:MULTISPECIES: zinc-binding dehydrogenase [unclassified Rhodopseudomonas]NEW87370.1 alcohol dehydrogenase [Rhodopseudomonas sp. WA056]NEW90386.1 alcohol dehydrogenase [Rhodopseudomonas sp. BR0M22]